MLKDISIKSRLIFMIALLSLMMLTIGGTGIFGLGNDSNSLKLAETVSVFKLNRATSL